MTLKTRIQSQRDSRWGSILLGFNTVQPYNIYNYGCLITSLANYIDKQPDEVNQILKNGNGFANGGDFVWTKCQLLGISQTYLSPRYQTVSLSNSEVNKLIGFLDLGFPALCEVDFNPADDDEQMHFVLAVGHTDGEILVVDPWEGQLETWSFASFQRNTYQYRIYDKKLEAGDSETLPVLKKDFENLVRKSSIYDKARQKLGVADGETIVIAEIDKFLTYEEKIRQQEKQLSEVQTHAAGFEKQAEDKAIELGKIQDTMTELQTKLKVAIDQNESLQKSIQELKQQATVQPTKPWYIKILELFKKGA
jgi:hypothetical protein